MAKIVEETVVITLSRLTKSDSDKADSVITDEILTTLESVVQELVGNSVIVEVKA